MVLKTKEEAKANFEAAIPYIPDRYESGIKKADWATPAGSDQAETNFADEMGKVIAGKLRQKGVKGVTNTEWQDVAVAKGKPVIGDRIRKALDTWATEWNPMYDKVTTLVPKLPASTTDFMTNINNRLVAVVKEWKKAAGKL